MNSTHAVVDISTLNIAYLYNERAFIVHPTGSNYVHLPLPSNISIFKVVKDDDGQVSIVEDAAKRAVAEVQLVEQKWASLRDTRNRMLKDSDWTQLNDTTLTMEMRQAYSAYRQQLRDLPQTVTDINNVTWPTPP